MLRSLFCRGLGLTKPGICLASTTTSAQRFDGKVAVITGCTGGIGLAVAESLGEEGASIVVNSRKQENVDKTVDQFRENGVKASGIVCNVGNAKDRSKLLDHALKEFGKIDIVVPNAALSPYFGPIFKTPEDLWDKIFETNVKGTFCLCKDALPELEKTKGNIVIINTSAAFHPEYKVGAYAISKVALLGMVKAMAPECAEIGVRVNGVAPGLIDTDFAVSMIDAPIGKAYLKKKAIKRPGQPKEIASVVKFLLSEEASYITGETIVAAGGYPSRL